MRTLVALVLAATSLALLVAAAALAYARGAAVALPLQSTVAIFPYSLVGFLVAWRRPSNPVGWLLLLAPLAFAPSLTLSEYAAFSTEPGAAQAALPALATWLSYWIWVPGWLSLAFVFLLFPDGRLPSPGWRPLGRALVGLTGVVAALVLALTLGHNLPFFPVGSAGWEKAVVLVVAVELAAGVAFSVARALIGAATISVSVP